MKLTAKSQCSPFPGDRSSFSTKPLLRPSQKQFLQRLPWHLSGSMFYFTSHQHKKALNIRKLKWSQNMRVLIRHFHVPRVWQLSGWFTSRLSIQSNNTCKDTRSGLAPESKVPCCTGRSEKLLFPNRLSAVHAHHWPVREASSYWAKSQSSPETFHHCKTATGTSPELTTSCFLWASATVHLLVSTQSRVPRAPCTLNVKGEIILTVNVHLGQHTVTTPRGRLLLESVKC